MSEYKSTKTNCLAVAALSFTHFGDRQETDRLCLIIHVYTITGGFELHEGI